MPRGKMPTVRAQDGPNNQDVFTAGTSAWPREGEKDREKDGGLRRSGPRPPSTSGYRGSAGVERPSPQLPGVQDQPGSRQGRGKPGEGKEI